MLLCKVIHSFLSQSCSEEPKTEFLILILAVYLIQTACLQIRQLSSSFPLYSLEINCHLQRGLISQIMSGIDLSLGLVSKRNEMRRTAHCFSPLMKKCGVCFPVAQASLAEGSYRLFHQKLFGSSLPNNQHWSWWDPFPRVHLAGHCHDNKFLVQCAPGPVKWRVKMQRHTSQQKVHWCHCKIAV